MASGPTDPHGSKRRRSSPSGFLDGNELKRNKIAEIIDLTVDEKAPLTAAHQTDEAGPLRASNFYAGPDLSDSITAEEQSVCFGTVSSCPPSSLPYSY